MDRAKITSHQTKISGFVPGALSIVTVPLVPGVVSPGVLAVAEETPPASVDTGPVRPALLGTVSKAINILLICLPPISTTVTVVTASLGDCPSVATAASGIAVPSGTLPFALTGRHSIVYRGCQPSRLAPTIIAIHPTTLLTAKSRSPSRPLISLAAKTLRLSSSSPRSGFQICHSASYATSCQVTRISCSSCLTRVLCLQLYGCGINRRVAIWKIYSTHFYPSSKWSHAPGSHSRP